jgi:4-hydroxy-tetrahydrodipicolinate reductase
VRAGYFPGTHELGFDSEADTIILRHTARGRQSLAEGALHAARWVVGKKGIFSFEDVLRPS